MKNGKYQPREVALASSAELKKLALSSPVGWEVEGRACLRKVDLNAALAAFTEAEKRGSQDSCIPLVRAEQKRAEVVASVSALDSTPPEINRWIVTRYERAFNRQPAVLERYHRLAEMLEYADPLVAARRCVFGGRLALFPTRRAHQSRVGRDCVS